MTLAYLNKLIKERDTCKRNYEIWFRIMLRDKTLTRSECDPRWVTDDEAHELRVYKYLGEAAGDYFRVAEQVYDICEAV